MPWRSLSHLDLETLRQVKALDNGRVETQGWVVPDRIWSHVIDRLITAGYVEPAISCVEPRPVRLTATGYAAINEPLPPRSWGVWEGKRQWPLRFASSLSTPVGPVLPSSRSPLGVSAFGGRPCRRDSATSA